jgi:hypothetical protein
MMNTAVIKMWFTFTIVTTNAQIRNITNELKSKYYYQSPHESFAACAQYYPVTHYLVSGQILLFQNRYTFLMQIH